MKAKKRKEAPRRHLLTGVWENAGKNAQSFFAFFHFFGWFHRLDRADRPFFAIRRGGTRAGKPSLIGGLIRGSF